MSPFWPRAKIDLPSGAQRTVLTRLTSGSGMHWAGSRLFVIWSRQRSWSVVLLVRALVAEHGDQVHVERRRPREVGEHLVGRGHRDRRLVGLGLVLEEHAAIARVGDLRAVEGPGRVGLLLGALGDRGQALAVGAVGEQDVLAVVVGELREAGGDEQLDLGALGELGARRRDRADQRALLLAGELVDLLGHEARPRRPSARPRPRPAPASAGSTAAAALAPPRRPCRRSSRRPCPALLLAARVGGEDGDRRALLDDLLGRGDLARDLGLGVGRLRRDLADREVRLAEDRVRVGLRLADDVRDLDLAVADGDLDRDLGVLLRLLAGCRASGR